MNTRGFTALYSGFLYPKKTRPCLMCMPGCPCATVLQGICVPKLRVSSSLGSLNDARPSLWGGVLEHDCCVRVWTSLISMHLVLHLQLQPLTRNSTFKLTQGPQEWGTSQYLLPGRFQHGPASQKARVSFFALPIVWLCYREKEGERKTGREGGGREGGRERYSELF